MRAIEEVRSVAAAVCAPAQRGRLAERGGGDSHLGLGQHVVKLIIELVAHPY